MITIKDTGLGIAPEQLPHMFELFVQGDRSVARSEGGLGIGLTIVRRLVEMHGGTITVESKGSGQGSTFKVRLTVVGATPNPSTPTHAPAAEMTVETARSRILVVDDNLDTARGLARLLGILGHEVRSAQDATEALAIVDQLTPDFILLDIGLPGMDGYELVGTLRERASCKDAIIIAISGYGQESDLKRSREAGFDYHLVKPVDHEALMSILAGK